MFDPQAYGPEIAAILARESDRTAGDLIKAANLTPLLRAGLYLYCDCWTEAHETAQDINTPDGSYWHAIVHRLEPDPGNAAYWYRQVGTHPIFPALRTRAAEIGLPVGARWDPFAFIDYATASPDSQITREVSRAEWQLLFAHCANL